MPPSPHPREKILLVDEASEDLQRLERYLGESYQVVAACGASAARTALEREGPFAVVVSEVSVGEDRGLELVDEALRTWPDTVAILMASMADVAEAIRPLHEGRVPRFFDKRHAEEGLGAALDSALDEHRARVSARREVGTLRFSRDTLEDFNSELVERIRIQTGAIHRLHRFVDLLNRTDSFEEIARLVAETAHEVTGGRGVHVHLQDHTDNRELATAEAGDCLSSETRCVDITTHEGRTGELRVDYRDAEGRKISSIEDDLLSSIASSTAAAVHNQLRRNERDEAQQATILALARLAEERDNETGKHLERVSLYCRLTAQGLRADGHHRDVITDEWIVDLVRSAPLHDIGKVGIPDAILLKPGKLDPAEWEIMKTHADIGAECLRGVMTEGRRQTFLQMSLDIAWCHHERWDGSGYPRGIEQTEIPLSARILALADVYDALTTVRPYKDAWTHKRAISWLAKVSGAHLDPDVVRAFLSRDEEANRIRERLADRADDVGKLSRRKAG